MREVASLVNNLRDIRMVEDLSQARLGALAGRTAETVAAIENQRRRADPRTRTQIVRALNENPNKRDKAKLYSEVDVFPIGYGGFES